MPLAFLSTRIDDGNRAHHLWNNNGTWWVHYTLNFDFRTRRVRRSLKTPDLAVAIVRRDELFASIRREGEEVPERRPRRDRPGPEEEAFVCGATEMISRLVSTKGIPDTEKGFALSFSDKPFAGVMEPRRGNRVSATASSGTARRCGMRRTAHWH